ncbi:flavodoxin domain-containing protein [Streptomyces sp. NPDC050504]|uniref:flavodoxin domain-containing protein n=1 Tax=Streptomyces sp. NPDC050504 TaxID=3365618 RepID=UPI003787A4B9
MNVLVGYATAHGSTREIAQRLCSRLRAAGLNAEARSLETVDDADAYRAFVLGSAVHGQAWLAPAKEFLRTHHDLLAARPVWIFSVGMPGALRGPWKRVAGTEEPVIVRDLPGPLSYREHRLLSGVIAPQHLPLRGRVLFRLMGCRYGDLRDWPAIDTWAADIADTLSRT